MFGRFRKARRGTLEVSEDRPYLLIEVDQISGGPAEFSCRFVLTGGGGLVEREVPAFLADVSASLVSQGGMLHPLSFCPGLGRHR